MKCPYCGNEMEQGTVEVRALRDKVRLWFYDRETPESRCLLGNLLRPGHSAENVEDEHPACRCADCKKIFVEFNEGIPL